jgi:YD repeat-containing protein
VTQLVVTAKGQTFTTRYGYDFNSRLTGFTRLRNAPDGATGTTAVTQLEYDGQGLLLRITEDGNVRRLVRDRTEALARPLMEMGATTTPSVVLWPTASCWRSLRAMGPSAWRIPKNSGRFLAQTDNTSL